MQTVARGRGEVVQPIVERVGLVVAGLQLHGDAEPAQRAQRGGGVAGGVGEGEGFAQPRLGAEAPAARGFGATLQEQQRAQERGVAPARAAAT